MSESFQKEPNRTRGHAFWVAAGMLLSRIAGLIRTKVFAYYLGNSDAAGAFGAALRIPNFLQNLFGEGVLSASFIPVYSRLLASGDPDAKELAGQVAGVIAALLGMVVGVLSLIGVGLTPYFVDLVAPGFHGEVRDLTVRIVRILFPGAALLVLSAWCLGILNSHRKFFLSYVAPVLWNLSMITTLLVFGRKLTHGDLAVALAWGTVMGSVLQFGVQLPFVFRFAHGIRFTFQTQLKPVREIVKNFGPVVLSRGVVQLSAYIDGMIASFLGAAAVSGLNYAQTLYLLPISLFGMSMAAAELPEMSSAQGSQEEIFAKLRGRLIAGQRKIAFFVIPSVVGFVCLGRELVGAIYQAGKFSSEDTLYVWYILAGSTVGLLAATWGRLYSSAFYALRDTRTPLRFAVLRVFLTASLGVLFAFPLRGLITAGLRIFHLPIPATSGGELGLGAVGLTASAGLAGWVEFLLLKSALNRKTGPTSVAAGYAVRLWTSAGVAGAFAFAAVRLAEPLLHAPVLRAMLGLGVFGAVYLPACIAFGIAEVAAIKRLLIRR